MSVDIVEDQITCTELNMRSGKSYVITADRSTSIHLKQLTKKVARSGMERNQIIYKEH